MLLADGNLQLFGRLDNQLKVRGYRIEPGEIENKLALIDGLKDAVVKSALLGENDERLIAYVSTIPGFNLSDREISRELSKTLPDYMIPSFYVKLDQLPRLPNGKTDRSALTFNISTTGHQQGEKNPEKTNTEQKLSIIWESVLRKEMINTTDNFFDLGGQSLLAIRVINRIRDEFNMKVNFNDMLKMPTIKKMAEYIDGDLAGRESA
jgi:acyl carrier protein